jgi:hypothetical protein
MIVDLVKKASLISGDFNLKTLNTGSVYLIPCLRENYAAIAEKLKIWHEPRTTHNSTIIVKHKSNTFILADKRFSPYLHPSYRVHINPSTKIIASEASGISCTDVCKVEK